MANWSDESVIDRLDVIRRDAAAVARLWPGAALLGIDDKGRMAMSGVDVPDPWGLSTDVVLGRRPSSAELEPTSSTWGPTCRWRAGPRSYGPAHLVAP